MNHVELLRVEQSLLLADRGVVLFPNFAAPDGWIDREEQVALHHPDGQTVLRQGRFQLTRFQTSVPAPVEERSRVSVLLVGPTDPVPVGTALLCSPTLAHLLTKQRH